MTTPNTPTPYGGQPADGNVNENQPTMPMPVAPPQDEQPQADGNTTERRYALAPQQLFRAIHDQLTTGATFTLDHENVQSGTFAFHSFDGARFTLSLIAEGAAGTAVRLSAVNDTSGRRSTEFFDSLDKRIGVVPAPGTKGGKGAAYATIAQQRKKTSKLAVFAVIVAVIYAFLAIIGDGGLSILIFLALIPALLAGFSLYITRREGSRQGRPLAWAAVIIIVGGLVAGEVTGIVKDKQHEIETAAQCVAYTWPDSELGALLPEPESTTGEIGHESETSFSIDVCDVSVEQFNDYIDAVKDKGFTVDYSKSSDSFHADNDAGYSVSIYYALSDENVMSISIDAPDDEADAAKPESESSDDATTKAPTTESQNQPSDSPTDASADDFKAAMDSYEAFFDKYVEFMTTYQNDGQPVSMLADYLDMMQQYSDTMAKLDAIDESTLTPEQSQYYLEVMGRVNQKLASVAQ